MIAGILIVNKDFVQFFLGQTSKMLANTIAIMAFRMFFIGWTNIMGIQILIPHNRIVNLCYQQLFQLFLVWA